MVKWMKASDALKELMNYQGRWMAVRRSVIYVSRTKEKLKERLGECEMRQLPVALGGYFDWKKIVVHRITCLEKRDSAEYNKEQASMLMKEFKESIASLSKGDHAEGSIGQHLGAQDHMKRFPD